jgi:hypothetical protein
MLAASAELIALPTVIGSVLDADFLELALPDSCSKEVLSHSAMLDASHASSLEAASCRKRSGSRHIDASAFCMMLEKR